jgi:hypothetical protein
VLAKAVAELAVFIFEARKAEGVFDGHEQLVRRERLFEKVESAEPRRFDGHFDIGLTGDEDDGRLYAGLLQIFEQFQAAAAGHHHVGKNQVKRFGAKKFDGAGGVVADSRFMTRQAEGAGERGQRVRIIVNEEEMSFARQALVLLWNLAR